MTMSDREGRRTGAALALTIAILLIVPCLALSVHLSGGSPDLVFVAYPVLCLIVWFAVARRSWRALGFHGTPHAAGWQWLAISYGVVAVVSVGGLVLAVALGVETVGNTVIDGPRILSTVLMVVLVAGVATGFAEELIYRGALLQLLRSRVSTVAAIAVSALLFSVAHAPNLLHRQADAADIPLRLALLALVGAALAYSVVVSRSLWIAIGWHAGSNGVLVGASALLEVTEVQYSAALAVVTEVVGIVVLIVLAHAAARRTRDVPRSASAESTR